jgi:hypothetical protein
LGPRSSGVVAGAFVALAGYPRRPAEVALVLGAKGISWPSATAPPHPPLAHQGVEVKALLGKDIGHQETFRTCNSSSCSGVEVGKLDADMLQCRADQPGAAGGDPCGWALAVPADHVPGRKQRNAIHSTRNPNPRRTSRPVGALSEVTNRCNTMLAQIAVPNALAQNSSDSITSAEVEQNSRSDRLRVDSEPDTGSAVGDHHPEAIKLPGSADASRRRRIGRALDQGRSTNQVVTCDLWPE